MTAGDLMVRLSKVARDAPVLAWDEDAGEYRPVTGIIWDDDGTSIFITTEPQDY